MADDITATAEAPSAAPVPPTTRELLVECIDGLAEIAEAVQRNARRLRDIASDVSRATERIDDLARHVARLERAISEVRKRSDGDG
jgi:methyl-accepting chemotaxis protein